MEILKKILAIFVIVFMVSLVIMLSWRLSTNEKKINADTEVKISTVFIIDIEQLKLTQDKTKYCLNYAIDGVMYSAIFDSMDRLNDYLNYLEGI